MKKSYEKPQVQIQEFELEDALMGITPGTGSFTPGGDPEI